MGQIILAQGPGFVPCSSLGPGRSYFVAGAAPNATIVIEAGTSTADGPGALVTVLQVPANPGPDGVSVRLADDSAQFLRLKVTSGDLGSGKVWVTGPDGSAAGAVVQAASGFINAAGIITLERHTSGIATIAWDPITSQMTVTFADLPFNQAFPYRSSLDIYDGDPLSPTYGGLIGILRPVSATPTAAVLAIVDTTVIPVAPISFAIVIVQT